MASPGLTRGSDKFVEVPVTDAIKVVRSSMPISRAGESKLAKGEDDGSSTSCLFHCGKLTGALIRASAEQLAGADANGPNLYSSVLVTYAVASVDEKVIKIEILGGKTHTPKTDIGGGYGFFGRVQGLDGNLQGV